MPRRPRIHAPGCFHHVTLRGNHRQPIFRERSDRALLDAIVAKSLAVSDARIHAYCWMTNHLHFLIQAGESRLGHLMRDIASNSARAYQAKLDTTGHLFERRYHAKLVHVEQYLFAVLRYIHRNPVEDGLAPSLEEYPWSSHRAYAGLAAPVPWLQTDFVLSQFARTRAAAREAYRRFVAGDATPAERAAITADGDVIGDDGFIARVRGGGVAGQPDHQSTLDRIIEQACERWGVTLELLMSAARHDRVVRARAWIAQEATARGIATLSEIARQLGRDRATLRYAIRRLGGAGSGAPKSP